MLITFIITPPVIHLQQIAHIYAEAHTASQTFKRFDCTPKVWLKPSVDTPALTRVPVTTQPPLQSHASKSQLPSREQRCCHQTAAPVCPSWHRSMLVLLELCRDSWSIFARAYFHQDLFFFPAAEQTNAHSKYMYFPSPHAEQALHSCFPAQLTARQPET